MNGDYSQDTIVAIATPPGEGGIGILRLSGPRSPEVAERVWDGKVPVSEMESHRLYLGDFVDPLRRKALDRGLLVRMYSPGSYTGEEVVEFHAHGGPLLLAKMLEVLLREGLRAAEPGEFTRRAFLNGKLDLLQAEAVGELIHAKSEAALHNARAQLEGRISSEVAAMRGRMIALSAELEAAIDFPEEDLEILNKPRLVERLQELEGELRQWVDRFQVGRLLREGLRIALVGRPNVGKSSLLNRLLGQDRAIVHDRPGTTRDVIEAWVEWEGLPVQLFDTAGIRDGEGEVEREGIRRSQAAAREADLVLWVLDASQALQPEDFQISDLLSGKVLPVANKIDVSTTQSHGWDPPRQGEWYPLCRVSAKTGEGLDALKKEVLGHLGLEAFLAREDAYLNNARHLEALHRGVLGLSQARNALEAGESVELPAAELRLAYLALEDLLGQVRSEDILSEVFSHFCIGK